VAWRQLLRRHPQKPYEETYGILEEPLGTCGIGGHSMIHFLRNLKDWQFMLGLYLIFSLSMGIAAFFKKPRRVWLEQHPEDK